MYLIFNFGKENKMQDKFKNINNNSRFAFGFEPEFMNSQNSDYDLNQLNRTSSNPVHGLTINLFLRIPLYLLSTHAGGW